MKKDLVIFWLTTLGVVAGVVWMLFPYAALPAETVARSHVPQPMTSMPDVNLPKPYGTVSVSDLVGYYIEHPPVAAGGTAGGDGGGHHFGGC